MKTFIQGGHTILITAATDIASGDVVKLTNMIAIASNDIASGEEGVAATVGVYTLDKNATEAITQGQTVYWSSADNNITTTATDNQVAGKAWEAATATATEVNVAINI
jgi:predicted RecA/RadA family phage recombinase